jgi:hypothetical protein
MKISSDWVVYYLRSFGLCDDNTSNAKIGRAVKQVLDGMGCIIDRKIVQVKSPVVRAMEAEFSKSEFAKIGCVYDLNVNRLQEFFKKLSDVLGIKLE